MGAYLSQPNTEKASHDESHECFSFGVSAMQGWRMAMEDAHCSLINFDEKQNSIFGVFDGHGGKEVAEYCAQNIHKFLLDNDKYQEGDIHKALKESFMAIDEALTSDEVVEELRALGGLDDQCNEEDEAAMLLEEANLPIEELLERMKSNVKEKLIENGIFQEKSDLDDQQNKINGHKDENTEETDIKDGASGRSRKQKRPLKKSLNGETSIKDDSSAKDTASGGSAESFSDSAAQSGSSDQSSASKVLNDNSSTENERSCSTEDVPGSSNEIKESTANDADADSKEKEESDDESDADVDDDDEDSDSEESDSDDEFEDSEGVEFQPGSDEVGKDSGTTAIVALIHNKKLYVANVGDSRCVLCRNGKPVDMSIDHKPEDEVEKNRIEKAGGKITMDGRVNGGLNLSRAIGDHAYKQNKDLSPEEQLISACPDIKEIDLTKDDDFMVLACDGIWNMMTSEEVVDFINERLKVTDEKPTLSKICEELFDRCLAPDTENDGSGCDNMTCLIVRFNRNAGEETTSSRLKRPRDDDQQQSKDSKKTKLSSMD